MDEVLIERVDQNEERTFGELFYQDVKVCDTLELPWKENNQFLSCIPEGTYSIRWSTSHHNNPCFEILNVPGRKGVLLHAANKVSELLGCIAPGIRSGEEIRGGTSKPAVEALGAFVKEAKLTIRNRV